MKIAVIGNYPPRECGIATYTQNFVQSLLSTLDTKTGLKNEIDVFAMTDILVDYNYPTIVKRSIHQNKKEEYLQVAELINQGKYDYCHIQHEYGIYGGQCGLFVNLFLTHIKIPLFITLHSVLKVLNFHQQQVLENMLHFSDQLVVMSKYARKILVDSHEIPREKISVIQHGAPPFDLLDKAAFKEALGWSKHKILMTFGLIGRSKGIEIAIQALPEICKNHPSILYVVLGKTHPHIVRNEGEIYRESLIRLASELGVDKNVLFLDKYVNEEDLKTYLSACDIYITPYLNEAQITSGTLTYAVSSGSAVLSTPYWHAVELLDDGRGILFDFEAPDQLATKAIDLLNSPEKLKWMQQTAFDYGKSISWKEVSIETLQKANGILSKIHLKTESLEEKLLSELPEFSLDHFANLSDSTGILQHATYSIVDYAHGYCTDDNARALIMALKLNSQEATKESEQLIGKFLSFLNYMQNLDGTFVNMLSYSKNHLSNNRSEDAFGRSVWALGYTVKYAPQINQKAFANELFLKAMPNFEGMNDLRGMAGSALGIINYLSVYKNRADLESHLENFLAFFFNSFQAISDDTWQWYEDKISYDNAIIPLAMYSGAVYFKNQAYIEIALKSLDFLESYSSNKTHLSLIGNEKWLEKGKEKSLFCQQPIDALSMTLIYHCLYTDTGNEMYRKKLNTAFSWFLGNNDLCTSMYDKKTKGCSDGLFESSLNLNQGGESLLAWLTAYLTYKSAKNKC
ncbi:MAG: glycosyltransferase family 4 protein [Bacteroidales bacterium]|nr:glycosyltransferase family 4 protein [Bacteroidales bacterium]